MTRRKVTLLLLVASLYALSSPVSNSVLGSNLPIHSSASGPGLALDGSATAKCQSPEKSTPQLVTCSATLTTSMSDDVIIAGVFTNLGSSGKADAKSVSYTQAGTHNFNLRSNITQSGVINMSEWYVVAPSPLQSATVTCTVETFDPGMGIDMIIFAVTGVDTSVVFDPNISRAEGWNFATNYSSSSETYISHPLTMLGTPIFVFDFGAFQSNPTMVGNEIQITSVTNGNLESAAAQYVIASGSSPEFTYTITPGESGGMMKDVLDGMQIIPTPEAPLGSLGILGAVGLAVVSYMMLCKFSRPRNAMAKTIELPKEL